MTFLAVPARSDGRPGLNAASLTLWHAAHLHRVETEQSSEALKQGSREDPGAAAPEEPAWSLPPTVKAGRGPRTEIQSRYLANLNVLFLLTDGKLT